MLQNHLRMALRTLRKHKGFSAINVLGLTVSLALCLVILLFIQDQRRFDRFHEHADRIYRVTTRFDHGTRVATSPHSLGPVLAGEYPEIERVVRLKRFDGFAARSGAGIQLRGIYAEEGFFELFSFALQAGNPAGALARPNTIVLSEEKARALFGESDAVGQTLTLDKETEVLVTGVLAPLPAHTSLRYEALVSFATLGAEVEEANWGWTTFQYYTYLLMRPGTSPEQLENALPAVIERHYGNHPDIAIAHLQLQPITGIRLGPMIGNQHGPTLPAPVVYMLALVALVVMVTACFNYTSLSVARALKRAREVGVRKVVGAGRRQIVGQFVSEALVIAFVAFLGAFALLFWFVPAFNAMWAIQFTGSQITIDFVRDLPTFALLLGFSLLVGLLAGLYPALYLSAFRPVSVLKGLREGKGFSRLGLRRALIVAQFTCSLLFIVTTLLLYRQSRLLLDADYGFDREQIVNVALQGVPYDSFREALERQPYFAAVSATSFLPGTSNIRQEQLWTSEPDEHAPVAAIYAADYHFLYNLRIRLLAGRNFSPAFAADSVHAVLINETGARALGFTSSAEAVGGAIHVGMPHRPEDAARYEIVGVVEDYHYTRLERAIGPMLLQYRPADFQYANVRLAPGSGKAAIEALEESWRRFGAVHPLQYRFFDEELAEEYATYEDGIRILGLASFFAILIACLGLFGMVTYAVETRTKEVGVRKVMGAGIPGLVLLLSRDFLLLVAVAVTVAVPLAWYLSDLWLRNFATRVALDGAIFVPSVLALLLLALVTIGSQTLRAARANPVETLRQE